MQLLGSLLNFQKDATACNVYHFTLQYGKQCKGASGILQITGSDTDVHRIVNYMEQLTIN